MGNFDGLAAEIRRRQQNRWALSALAVTWSSMFLMMLSLPVLRA